MTSSALFGNTSGLGGSTGNSKHLVEFRAGRMTLKGRMVHPDKRKGFLYVYQSDDSLMHFCWKDRVNGAVEDDLIIFPDDCEFIRVHQCTTGRVYVLKFKSSSRKLFFWMQEPKTDKDEEYCRRINEVLNNPPTVGGGRGGNSSNAPDGDLQNLLNSMSQQQLMQLFGNVGQIGGLSSLLGTISRPSTGSSSRASSGTPGSRSRGESLAPSRPPRVDAPAATPPTPSTTITPSTVTTQPSSQQSTTQPKSGQAIHLSDLQRYLSKLSVPGGTAATSVNVEGGSSGSLLATALVSPPAVAAVTPHASELVPYLPKQSPDTPVDVPAEVRSNLLSPQFAQAAKLFNNALSSGQLGPVISQFGLGTDVVNAANKGDVEDFLKELEKSENTESTNEDEEKSKNDDDEQMELD